MGDGGQLLVDTCWYNRRIAPTLESGFESGLGEFSSTTALAAVLVMQLDFTYFPVGVPPCPFQLCLHLRLVVVVSDPCGGLLS